MDNATDPSVTTYSDTLQDDDPEVGSLHSLVVDRDGTGFGGQQTVRQVRIALQDYTFDQLVDLLVEYEEEYGMSTVEMFSQYVKGTLDPTGDLVEWLGVFLLYLNAEQVSKLYCR